MFFSKYLYMNGNDDKRPSALVMCYADASKNPRPNRIIKLLYGAGLSVDVLALPLGGRLPVRRTYTINTPSLTMCSRIVRKLFHVGALIFAGIKCKHFSEFFYASPYGFNTLKDQIPDNAYDLIFVEDLNLLPLAFRKYASNGRSKIIFDAREYYPRQNEERRLFRWLERPIRTQLCREYLPRCDFLMTVSPGLARAYKQEFGVNMEVIRSTPVYYPAELKPTNGDQIRMVHHGGANRNRGLENLIEIVRRLDDRFTLDLYLVGNPPYIEELRAQASDCPRIRFCKPVLFDQILPMLNQYDIGFYYLEPTGFNVTYNLPNKFFEFLQARLAIAIGPSPDMADLVQHYQCGFVAPEFSIDAMVRTLQMLTPEMIDAAKRQSDLAAQELCWERESEKITAMMKMFDQQEGKTF